MCMMMRAQMGNLWAPLILEHAFATSNCTISYTSKNSLKEGIHVSSFGNGHKTWVTLGTDT